MTTASDHPVIISSRDGSTSPSSSTTSSSSSSSSSNGSEQGKSAWLQYLTTCPSYYCCRNCRTQLADHDELISRSFRGNQGRAYLFNSVINISCGPSVRRELATGSHAVSDFYCAGCKMYLGWRYEKAFVGSQKYKEGKYIIEMKEVLRENKQLESDTGLELAPARFRRTVSYYR